MSHHQLPEGWRRVSLEDVADVQTGLAIGKIVNGDAVTLPYLRVANVQDGYVDLREMKEVTVSARDAERFRLQHEDVLMTEGGDFDKLGRGCVWQSQVPNCLHQNHVFAVRTHRDRLSPQFFAFHAAGPIGRLYFLGCSKQSTNLASINSTQLRQMPVPLPPLDEQKAIAGVLSVWDRAIEQTTALIAAKQRLKQGLMQQLLTGQRRFKGFKGEWQECHLGDVVEEVRRYVTVEDDTQYRLVSVRRNSGGLFDREPRPGREIGYSKLMTVEDGDFLIARRQVIHGAMTIVRTKFHGAFVSDAYAALVPKRKNELHMPFLDILSRMPRMYYSAFRCSYGVAIEKMVFHLEWFLRETIHVPPKVDEQVKLASLFDEIDRELKQLQRRVTSLQKQKRGLMQKLLTGDKRLPVKLIKEFRND
jgi:type I restriction enzyme S subunit